MQVIVQTQIEITECPEGLSDHIMDQIKIKNEQLKGDLKVYIEDLLRSKDPDDAFERAMRGI